MESVCCMRWEIALQRRFNSAVSSASAMEVLSKMQIFCPFVWMP